MTLDWRCQVMVCALVSLLTFVTTAPVREEPIDMNSATDPKNAEISLPLFNNLDNNSPAIIAAQHLVPIAHEEKEDVQPPKPKEDEYDYEIPSGYLPDISNDQLKAMGMVMLEGVNKADLRSIQNIIAKRILEESVAKNDNAGQPSTPSTLELSSNQNISEEPITEAGPNKEDIPITEERKEEQINDQTSLETGVEIGNPDCKYPGCLEHLSLAYMTDLASQDPVWFRGEEVENENDFNDEALAFNVQPQPAQPEKNIKATDEYDSEPFQNAKFNAYDYPQYPESKVSGYIQKWLPHGDRISDRVAPFMESQKPSPPAASPPQFIPRKDFSSQYQPDLYDQIPVISTGFGHSDQSAQSKTSQKRSDSVNIPFIRPYNDRSSNMVYSPKLAETDMNESPYHQSIKAEFAGTPPFPAQPPPIPTAVKSNIKHPNIGTWLNPRRPLSDRESNPSRTVDNDYKYDFNPTANVSFIYPRAPAMRSAFKSNSAIQNLAKNFDYDNPTDMERSNFDKNNAEQKVPFDALPGLAIDGDADEDYKNTIAKIDEDGITLYNNQKDENRRNEALHFRE
ncbi:hypothetical protein Ocin01_00807 [Orchesella cincta]|uniref:Uncharacterized protein n=1 Tax=Orchesella cincta TaxID=48709 RepID=A0A1D2NKR9_ORCCI|nr:hypothetical protein Ocin01_00807 [Orchesella cincta]